ncbi:LytTR family DNA-binding domain-containing protein [Frigidibacter sp. RF13]|uniref:LytTR family DNA-binding domain-containing protein n=1 Tax=Frigidibacter sp. RF13 TaxID=2997340 RepID=UPI00226E0EBB|nr:LytTR family DNA-binding domain-containing protein [Frigidibacter sp. RF13]MCY1128607.1 LytTR family DNA-binding domain-containing protein [Frigidibacter sp. RF13]
MTEEFIDASAERKVRLVWVTGVWVNTRVSAFWPAIRDPITVALYFVATLSSIIILSMMGPPGPKVLFITAGMIFGIAMCFACAGIIYACVKVVSALGYDTVYTTPILMTAVVLMGNAFCYFYKSALGVRQSFFSNAAGLLVCYVAIELAVLLYVFFFRKRVRDNVKKRTQDYVRRAAVEKIDLIQSVDASAQVAGTHIEMPARNRVQGTVVIAGEAIAIAELRLIEAEDDYCRISTQSRNHFVRARISDVAAMLPEAAGQLVHRSYWIATSAIAVVYRMPDRNLRVILNDGKKIPVARSRASAFLSLVSELGLSVKNGIPDQGSETTGKSKEALV